MALKNSRVSRVAGSNVGRGTNTADTFYWGFSEKETVFEGETEYIQRCFAEYGVKTEEGNK